MNKERTGSFAAPAESVEIELSTEELRNLSQPRISRVSRISRVEPTACPSGRSTTRIAGSAAAVIMAACAGVWALNADIPSTVDFPPIAEIPDEEPVALAPPPVPVVPAGQPVLVRNPFDRGEVFEFPPGTSEEEARAWVADALMQRAMERQAHVDARPTKRRRAG